MDTTFRKKKFNPLIQFWTFVYSTTLVHAEPSKIFTAWTFFGSLVPFLFNLSIIFAAKRRGEFYAKLRIKPYSFALALAVNLVHDLDKSKPTEKSDKHL